ncbi:MAG TPA: non-ribosomal peptide synthetase, partial [Thermoanaerobaculia bacterium]|nr:non-ribosomal peptide synthetase [Thermoanaerobaculia bacterium]
GPEVPVAVLAERSLATVVGLRAIAKAGGAYLPLDPAYPPERLAWMLTDARPRVLLGRPDQLDTLPAMEGGAIVVELTADPDEAGGPEPAGPLSDTVCYVMYTSGSTGRPKGVLISHRALVNRMLGFLSEFSLSDDDVLLQKTAFGFDPSLCELVAPLLAGARVAMAGPESHRNPAALARDIAGYGITFLQLVPSMLAPLLEEKGLADCRGLRRVLCGGEVLSPALRDAAFARLDAELYNYYGPTECTIDSTFWRCRPGDGSAVVPIGRPVANGQVYMLDRALRPVPPGTVGELYIGGANVARGYLGRPDLTAERFLPDPYSSAPGGRLYRTGDLARHRFPQGAIEYVGRADLQVKVRGVRIELAEIESALARHPGVLQAVVTARDDGGPVGRRLAAYLVGNAEPAELRRFLAAELPEVMIPAAWVKLDALPLTPNGKVDRAALPAPEGSAGAEVEYVPPSSPLEETLARAAAETLGVERVGMRDNFFDLGGHSLLATQLVSRLTQEHGLDVDLQMVFQAPDLAGLADRIVDRQLAQFEGLEELEGESLEEMLRQMEARVE